MMQKDLERFPDLKKRYDKLTREVQERIRLFTANRCGENFGIRGNSVLFLITGDKEFWDIDFRDFVVCYDTGRVLEYWKTRHIHEANAEKKKVIGELIELLKAEGE